MLLKCADTNIIDILASTSNVVLICHLFFLTAQTPVNVTCNVYALCVRDEAEARHRSP